MIPIMEVLTAKGMAMGTALAFMMAVIGLLASGDDHTPQGD